MKNAWVHIQDGLQTFRAFVEFTARELLCHLQQLWHGTGGSCCQLLQPDAILWTFPFVHLFKRDDTKAGEIPGIKGKNNESMIPPSTPKYVINLGHHSLCGCTIRKDNWNANTGITITQRTDNIRLTLLIFVKPKAYTPSVTFVIHHITYLRSSANSKLAVMRQPVLGVWTFSLLDFPLIAPLDKSIATCLTSAMLLGSSHTNGMVVRTNMSDRKDSVHLQRNFTLIAIK